MISVIQSTSPTNSDYSFNPPSEMDFTSLFEQCGIPLADLSSHIYSPATVETKGAPTAWYQGTAPKDGDLMGFEEEEQRERPKPTLRARSEAFSHSDQVEQDLLAEVSFDGFGNATVSPDRGQRLDNTASSVSVMGDSQAGERAHTSPDEQSAPRRHDRSATSSPTAPECLKAQPSPDSCRSKRPPQGLPTTPPSSETRKALTTAESLRASSMDLYSQQHYYNGAQLSSPISMQSSPDDETLFYTPGYSPPFGDLSSLSTGAFSDSEAMRRSVSTPFLGERTFGGLSPASFSMGINTDCITLNDTLSTSSARSWGNTGTYRPHPKLQQFTGIPSSLGTSRPTMRRKTRPLPIATSNSQSFAQVGPHTAPLERSMMQHQQIERPQLSAKRSFEDFSDVNNEHFERLPYRHIATPTNKRARSSQGFGLSMPASPFADESLFSPGYNNGLAIAMDPEQLLLSSPPYSQTDFCQSPSYMIQPIQETLSDYVVPNSNTLQHQNYLYSHPEPLSPLDVDGVWAQKSMYNNQQQIGARSALAVPRSTEYSSSSSPLRRVASKPRRSSMARPISFCNYTAADRNTILSGVAPSGSNKKALLKSDEMSRSRSSSAIVV